MRRPLLVSAMLLLAAAASAQPLPAAGSGTPAGNTDGKGGTATTEPSPGVVPAECGQKSRPPTQPGKVIAVKINPASRWQPRGGEVLVEITAANPADLASLTVVACFGWAEGNPDTPFAATQLMDTFRFPAPAQVRPSSRSDLINIGVIVPPDLVPAPSSFVKRFQQSYRAFAFGVIPAASMRLIGYDAHGVAFDVIKNVGVTTVWFAVLFTTVSVAVLIAVLFRLAGHQIGPVGATGMRAIASDGTRAFLRFRWVLLLMRSEDGRASLSSFQVLLWTVIVVASASYVMMLSGELINISDGTLVILGIAGGAKIIRRSFAGGPRIAATGVMFEPAWSDLVRPDRNSVADVADLQMLLFTLVCAGFVALQVLTSYVIPEIPTGYQILMGITNGVYVGAKIIPPVGGEATK